LELRKILTNIAEKLERSKVRLRLIESDEGLYIFETADSAIYNVVFNRHSVAKAAFVQQRSLKVRMHIPENSSPDWLRPSPRFHVEYETLRRLTVRSGKATCPNANLGDLLMSNYKGKNGCYI